MNYEENNVGYVENMFDYTERTKKICLENDLISDHLFEEYGVYRGLRDTNGKGVATGLTNISKIISFQDVDGKKVPCDGQLWYRGYPVDLLIHELGKDSFGFESTAYLLLFGERPDSAELLEFRQILAECRNLPTNFTRDHESADQRHHEFHDAQHPHAGLL